MMEDFLSATPVDAIDALNEWLRGGPSSPLSSADNRKIYRGTAKLYGRSKEQERILQVYQRIAGSTTTAVAERRTEFILIEGETGSGKTALAESARSLAAHNNHNHHHPQQFDDRAGYCVLGKFDQLVQLQKPHSAFVEALTEYSEAVVERGQVERVRQRVRVSTEKDAIPVLVKMIPALATILLCDDDDDGGGDNAALEKCDTSHGKEWYSSTLSSDSAAAFGGSAGFTSTSSEAASTQCKDALRVFLRAIASPETPFVLVLDDCHWMDEAALDMLQSLLTDTVNQGILFIGTCRSDDAETSTTNSSHHQSRFTSMIHQLSPQEVTVTRIHLTMIDEADTRAMLADLFQQDESKVASLAHFVSSQTRGNAFFILECLRALMEGEYVRYNKTSNVWSWDVEEIGVDFGGTLSELVGRKISQLPKETLESLKYASCLGTKIDKEILGHLVMRDSPPTTIEFCLETAAARGLLNRNAGPSMNISWSFSHDSIREVAYSMIPVDCRADFHYRIGRRLYRAFAMKEADDRIFIIVSQLIVGSSFLVDKNERIGVANLCYHAGARAVRMLSFQSAYRLLKHGCDLLDSTCWHDEYDLCLSLYSALAEVSYCTQRFEEVLLLVEDVSNQARSNDLLRVSISKVRALGSSGRVREAVEYAFELLRGLGEHFPKHSNHLNLYIQIQKLRRRLRKKTSESLLRIPDMTDQSKSDAMSIMNLVYMYLYIHDPERSPMVALRMVSVSLDYGLCAASSMGFTVLGGILCGPLNRIKEGGRIAKAGLQMYERFGYPVWLPRVASGYYIFVHYWIGTIESSLDPLKAAYEIGMTHGDVEFAFAAAMTHTFVQFETRPLLETLSAYERLRERMLFYSQKTVWDTTRPFCQCIHNLLGRAGPGGPTVLEGEILDHGTLCHFQEHSAMLFLFANVHLMVLSYLFGDTEQATECAKVIRPLTNYPPGGMEGAMLVFYDGLIAARNAQTKPKAWRCRRRAENQLKRLSHWAKYAPHTFLCRAFLLEAELRVACGDHLSAHSKYVAAIALAQDSGFLSIVALSNELAAKYFLQRSEEKIAEGFLREAFEYYERWGATAKAENLRKELKELNKEEVKR